MEQQYIYIGDHKGWGVSIKNNRDGVYWFNVHACGIASTNSKKLTDKSFVELIEWFKKKWEETDD